jgi:hypothetical protein
MLQLDSPLKVGMLPMKETPMTTQTTPKLDLATVQRVHNGASTTHVSAGCSLLTKLRCSSIKWAVT